MNHKDKSAISLFCGAGGMDIGFQNAGFCIKWANDYDKDACETYRSNIGNHVVCGDINELLPSLTNFEDIDCLFGGPPCQGFSIAGNMNPFDERSKLVMSFMDAVKIANPKVFVMENVKALGKLAKFQAVRNELHKRAHLMGYETELLILNSKDFGVPQSRERMFLIGFQGRQHSGMLADHISKFECESPTVREAIEHLGPAGSKTNNQTVKAKITTASSPVLRKSPYAGMLFNGQGRPVNIDSYSSTLHASMGGNRTPIIDEEELYNNATPWIEEYHKHLIEGGCPLPSDAVPTRLRRMTVDEAHLLQTFPENYKFIGKQSSIFRQIGNAVPCKLAQAVANLVSCLIDNKLDTVEVKPQHNLSFEF